MTSTGKQMTEKISNAERYRQERKQQVKDRRTGILNAAQELFLEKGLEKTSMQDIAEKARISKVTLYRYFPDRHPIAFETAVRMLRRIVTVSAEGIPEDEEKTGALKAFCTNMIDRFDILRDAYRYIGMFDHLYGDSYPAEDLASWYKSHIFDLYSDRYLPVSRNDLNEGETDRITTLGNTVMSFLEKMAARGELMGTEQEVPLERQLAVFRDFISRSFDSFIKGG